MMHNTLPAHEIHVLSMLDLVKEVVLAPATLIALAVVAIGLTAWWQRNALKGVSRALNGIGTMARNHFGFEAINKSIVNVTFRTSESLRNTQTGIINWNILYILAGLVILMAILALGA